MTERNPHPDNDLIDQLQEGGATPAQGSRSRGTVRADVGTRAELEQALGDQDGVTRATGSDNPGQDAMKGPKTTAEIKSGNQG